MTIKEGGRSLRFMCTGAVSYLENKAVRRRANEPLSSDTNGCHPIMVTKQVKNKISWNRNVKICVRPQLSERGSFPSCFL